MNLTHGKNERKKSNAIIMVLLFLIVTIDSGFYFVNQVSGTIRLMVSLFAIICLMILLKFNMNIIKSKNIIAWISVLFFPLIFGLFALDGFKQTIIICLAITVGYWVTVVLNEKTFFFYYQKIVFFLCVYSLVALVIYFVFPQIINFLPVIHRNVDKDISYNFYNAGFSILNNNSYVTRNFGFFWEPGAFAIFINIALYHELFNKDVSSLRNIVVFFITVLSTLSTLGIICAGVLGVAYICRGKRNRDKRVSKIILAFFVLFGCVSLFFGDYFVFHVFDKLKPINGSMNDSTKVRIEAIVYPLKEFVSSPLWGIGYQRFLFVQENFCNDMATFTFINWLTIYGVLGAALPIIGCVKFFMSRKRENIFVSILLFVFSLLLFSTENFVQITFIYILIFYGLNFNEKVIIYRN